MNRVLKRWLIGRRVPRFLSAIDRLLAPALAEFGFAPEQTRAERLFAEKVFGCGSRYVKLTMNLHPRDSPNRCNVILGEGRRTWPETDWNSVALWALTQLQLEGSTASEYLLADSPDVGSIVERMRGDLLTYAVDFLRGELTSFQAARSSVNGGRAPYFIDGRIDPESAALKERFS